MVGVIKVILGSAQLDTIVVETCYSISYIFLSCGHPPIPGAWMREVSLYNLLEQVRHAGKVLPI